MKQKRCIFRCPPGLIIVLWIENAIQIQSCGKHEILETDLGISGVLCGLLDRTLILAI
jgi:hypothetical protein